ncbi:helicase [Streptomyces sp. NPDC057217]|uniref:helicase n=1 Tax=Streptomyces sp. NPDC057217 TaxID=3346054 RepID=UPI00362B347B
MRASPLVRQHTDEGGALPVATGEVVRQGEDLGRWVRVQRLGFYKLTSVRQWMSEHVLGITPATEEEKPKPRTSQAEKWTRHCAATRRFHEHEGHLTVSRKHLEALVPSSGEGERQEQRECRSSSAHGSATSAPGPRR